MRRTIMHLGLDFLGLWRALVLVELFTFDVTLSVPVLVVSVVIVEEGLAVFRQTAFVVTVVIAVTGGTGG
jgi:hypothetical protein